MLLLNKSVLKCQYLAYVADMPVLEKTNQLLYLHHSVKLEHRSYHGNTLSQVWHYLNLIGL